MIVIEEDSFGFKHKLKYQEQNIFFNQNNSIMQSFKDFQLDNPDLIFGGDLEPTYVGANGDYYDTERQRYIFIS